jgi:hypothetical protein
MGVQVVMVAQRGVDLARGLEVRFKPRELAGRFHLVHRLVEPGNSIEGPLDGDRVGRQSDTAELGQFPSPSLSAIAARSATRSFRSMSR